MILMITSKQQLKEFIEYEHTQYCAYMYPTFSRHFWGKIKCEPIISIMNWQKTSRKADYYRYRRYNNPTFCELLFYLFYTSLRNRVGQRLGIEIDTYNVGKGLLIYHYTGGIALSSEVIIGANCHLHGNNCIGNTGIDNNCPVIGNNVMIGVGAKIIGNVRIADGVKIAAGAVVIDNILEPGCTVAGVPAKVVKHHSLK